MRITFYLAQHFGAGPNKAPGDVKVSTSMEHCMSHQSSDGTLKAPSWASADVVPSPVVSETVCITES